jgi:hypothetical protein
VIRKGLVLFKIIGRKGCVGSNSMVLSENLMYIKIVF